jgi:2-keto-3-deoxy-L-rhamnonate aldolase RhmA
MTLRYKAADFLNGSMEGGVDNQIAGFSEFMKTLGQADVWGLNPNGELVSWVIIESREGLRNVGEIAKEKGIGVLIPGSGTLSGVLRNDPDPDAWEKAQQTILAAGLLKTSNGEPRA